MTTDTSEKGLETLIMRHMTGLDGLVVAPNMVAQRPPAYGGTGFMPTEAKRGKSKEHEPVLMIGSEILNPSLWTQVTTAIDR